MTPLDYVVLGAALVACAVFIVRRVRCVFGKGCSCGGCSRAGECGGKPR